jgi:exodeoxyribonuclease VII small subunit
MKFEVVMENLQTIVQEMESGDLPLDDLIKRYEEGMKLVKISRDKLTQAEQRIEVLTKVPNHSSTSESTTTVPTSDDSKLP